MLDVLLYIINDKENLLQSSRYIIFIILLFNRDSLASFKVYATIITKLLKIKQMDVSIEFWINKLFKLSK